MLVLNCIKEQDISLPSFLQGLFGSEDDAVKQWTHQFYKAEGPRRVIDIWGNKLRHLKDWDTSFVNSAVDVVVCRTKRDLDICRRREVSDSRPEKLSVVDDKSPAYSYRMPHNKVTENNIELVLSDGFLDRYANHASYLMRFLDGVLYKKYKKRGKGKTQSISSYNNVNHGDLDSSGDNTEGEEDEYQDGIEGEQDKEEKSKRKTPVAKVDMTENERVAHKSGRSSSSVRGCIAAILMFMRSQQSNSFQVVMGIYLDSIGCPRRGLEVLSALGLCVSYEQVRRSLDSLAKDSLRQVQEAVLENDWYVVYDNINIAMKHHHQRVDKKDMFENGTAATVILIPADEDSVSFQNGTSSPFRPLSELPKPSASIFFPTFEDQAVARASYCTHLSFAIARFLPHAPDSIVIPMQPIDEMKVAKTAAFPLPTMKIDESTIAGNMAVLDSITKLDLRLTEDWFQNKSIIVGGDQMTVARLLSLKNHRAIETDPFGSLDWVHPTPQFFHLQMTLCSTIYNTHLGTDANIPGSLASFISLLGSKGFNKDKPEYKATVELLRIVFDAMSMVLWESLSRSVGPNELKMSKFVEIVIAAIASLNRENPSLNGQSCSTADINALYFIRDMTVFIEFSDSIKIGDRGRIRGVLPTIAIMMHGGGNHNYALELLRLLYGMRYAWTPQWERRVLSSMLVNPKGIPNGWMPTDMYQENNNYLIKNVHAANGPNVGWEYLREKISPIIRTFQTIRSLFERGVASKFNSSIHKYPSTEQDVGMVSINLKFCGILWDLKEDNRSPPPLVKDLWRVGIDKMNSGAIGRFLIRATRHDAVDLDEVDANEHVISE